MRYIFLIFKRHGTMPFLYKSMLHSRFGYLLVLLITIKFKMSWNAVFYNSSIQKRPNYTLFYSEIETNYFFLTNFLFFDNLILLVKRHISPNRLNFQKLFILKYFKLSLKTKTKIADNFCFISATDNDTAGKKYDDKLFNNIFLYDLYLLA